MISLVLRVCIARVVNDVEKVGKCTINENKHECECGYICNGFGDELDKESSFFEQSHPIKQLDPH